MLRLRSAIARPTMLRLRHAIARPTMLRLRHAIARPTMLRVRSAIARPTMLRLRHAIARPTRNAARGAATYKLADSQLGMGLLRIHLAQLESFLTSPVNLDREGVAVQGTVTFNSVRGHCARYLGWLSQRDGGAEAVSSQGLLLLLDGPWLMDFCAYLLRERALKLSTVTQAFLSLTKVRSRRHDR